jgi:hypothetical protein
MSQHSSARPLSRIAYGIADLALAALYLLLFLKLVPARSTAITLIATTLALVTAAGGVGMFLFTVWGRRIAAICASVMLLACAVLILLLVASAAYLHGIYDGIGEAGVAFALLAAALSIELVGLVPALQLAYLRRTAR